MVTPPSVQDLIPGDCDDTSPATAIVRRFAIPLILSFVSAAHAGNARLNVAVLPFSGQGIDSISALVISDALSDELMRLGKVQVMERSQIKSILDEQGFQQTGACDGSECAVQTGRLLSVQDVVVGTVGRLGESYSISVRLVDVETGQVVRSSRRMQQGAIDAVVSNVLPVIAAELLDASPLAPKVTPPLASPPPVSVERHSTPWEARHEGGHWRTQVIVGVTSFVEAPLGLRVGFERDGFGGMVGAGPLLPVMSLGNALGDYRLTSYVPQIVLFYGWRNLQFDLSYCRAAFTESSKQFVWEPLTGYSRTADVSIRKTFESFSADLEIGMGLPGRPNHAGGFGVLVGIGYQSVEESEDGSVDPDPWRYPVPHFGITLSY